MEHSIKIHIYCCSDNKTGSTQKTCFKAIKQNIKQAVKLKKANLTYLIAGFLFTNVIDKLWHILNKPGVYLYTPVSFWQFIFFIFFYLSPVSIYNRWDRQDRWKYIWKVHRSCGWSEWSERLTGFHLIALKEIKIDEKITIDRITFNNKHMEPSKGNARSRDDNISRWQDAEMKRWRDIELSRWCRNVEMTRDVERWNMGSKKLSRVQAKKQTKL